MEDVVAKVDDVVRRERASRLVVLAVSVVALFTLVGIVAGAFVARVTAGNVTAPLEEFMGYQVELSEREQCRAQIEAAWEIAIDGVINALATGALGDVRAAVDASRAAAMQLAAVNELCPTPGPP